MSVDKVRSYLDNITKSAFRRGYSDVLPVLSENDYSAELRTSGSIDRVEKAVGIGTNNRAEGFHFQGRHLSTIELLEQRAQKDFNRNYMKNIEELNKLRVSQVVSQLSDSLREGSEGLSFSDLRSQEDSKPLLVEGEFDFPDPFSSSVSYTPTDYTVADLTIEEGVSEVVEWGSLEEVTIEERDHNSDFLAQFGLDI